MYFLVKGFFLCFSGCISNSDSGDDCTEIQTLKFCEPSQGKLSNAKAGAIFQVCEVNSAIKLLLPFHLLMLLRVWDHGVFVCIFCSYKEIN